MLNRLKLVKNGKVLANLEVKGGLINFAKTFWTAEFSALVAASKPPVTLVFDTSGYIAERVFEETPTKEAIVEELNKLREEVIQVHRNDRRVIEETEVTRLNNMVRYKTVGGVFTKPDSIKTLLGPNYRKEMVKKIKVPDVGSKSYHLGLELEIVAHVQMEQFVDMVAAAGLHKHVNVGTDSSIHPDKGGRGFELRICVTEQECASVMKRVCDLINTEPIRAYVNNSCGFHVHIDSRNRNPEHVYKNLVMGLPLLSKMVPQNRIKGDSANRYCKQNESGVFDTGVKKGDRYMAINPTSFAGKKTIEVRLHSGTTNFKKIMAWCNVLTTLVNHDKTLNKKIETVAQFKKLNSDETLTKYMQGRVNLFSKAEIDTSTDDMLDSLVDLNVFQVVG